MQKPFVRTGKVGGRGRSRSNGERNEQKQTSGPSNSCISGTAVCRGHVKAACVNSLRYVALLPVLMTSWRPSAEWAVKASSSISSSTVAFEDDGTLELLTGVRD